MDDMSRQPSCGSAPASYRQKPKAERLQPLQLSPRLGHSASASSSIDKAPRDIGIPGAPFLIDSAIQKVQSLALAKIELKRKPAQSDAKMSPRKVRMQPLPLEAQPLFGPMVQAESRAEAKTPPAAIEPTTELDVPPKAIKEGADDMIAKAREMMRRKAEEKALLFADNRVRKKVDETITTEVAPEDAEEEPWRSFHASYMRADQMNEAPEKVADKAVKQLESSMKVWEERMRKTATSDVEVTQDGSKHSKLLEGGYLETAVCFAADDDQITDREEGILRTVAATVRMRGKLRLQLIGCGAELESATAIMRRLCNVQQFFELDGIPCNAVHAVRPNSSSSFVRPSWIAQPRFVLCRLHMNNDMELCGHLLGTLFSPDSKTRNQAAWLKSNFQITTY